MKKLLVAMFLVVTVTMVGCGTSTNNSVEVSEKASDQEADAAVEADNDESAEVAEESEPEEKAEDTETVIDAEDAEIDEESGLQEENTADTTVPDLTGSWKQSNSNSEDSYQLAGIQDDTITVYWYTVSDGTSALYWTGTYEAPADSGAYSWDSKNYHDISDRALLASGDDTKTFKYENGELSYSVSFMGVTTTVTLEKADDLDIPIKKGSTAEETAAAQEVAKQSVEAVKEALVFDAKPTLDGDVALFITNGSDSIINELEVKINYIDESGMVIDQATDGHDMILPGHTVVSKMETPSMQFADANVEYTIDLSTHSGYINHSDDVEVTYNPGDGCVMVQIKNNSDVSIDEIEYDVVLFNGEDVVSICYPEDIYDLAAGASTTEKCSVYSHKTYNSLVYGTDYDRIEVYLNQAHTFGF